MLTVYDTRGGALINRGQEQSLSEATVWVDLLNPTLEEEQWLERELAISIPTREEMNEPEASSRLYHEDRARYMTATVLHRIDETTPAPTAITFILADHVLVTVRYAEPKAFALFLAQATKGNITSANGTHVLLGLLEAIIDRTSDLVQRLQSVVDRLAGQIFDMRGGPQSRSRRYDVVLKQIGHEGELVSKARESLHSIARLLSYLTQFMLDSGADKALRARIKVEARDVASLTEHVSFLAQRTAFMLDATLGMIGIEQNKIIKLFSVAAVILMPPTLIASIYGMNFKHMPELAWVLGYPWALGLMVLAAVLPLWFIKRRGWL